MRASINITQFLIVTLVIQLVLTAKEIKKRGLYELPLHQHYPYFLDPIRFDDYNSLNFLPEWNNLLFLNPSNLYHGLHHHHHHNPLLFNHLQAPWQIFNLADIHLPTPITVASLPQISFPQAKLPTNAAAHPSPSSQDYQPLNLQTSSFQPQNHETSNPSPNLSSASAHPSPPATASHPQAGSGRLGSGSLGVVVLPNGRVALGSGSLGYAPTVSATPAPAIANAAQNHQDNVASLISQLHPFLNSLEQPTRGTVDGLFEQLNNAHIITQGQRQETKENLGALEPASVHERPTSNSYSYGHQGQPNRETIGSFVPASIRPSSNSFSYGHIQPNREHPNGIVSASIDRPSSNSFSYGHIQPNREHPNGIVSASIDRPSSNSFSYGHIQPNREHPTSGIVSASIDRPSSSSYSYGQGQNSKDNQVGFVPIIINSSQRPNSNSFSNGHRGHRDNLDGFVSNSDERPHSNSYTSGRVQNLF